MIAADPLTTIQAVAEMLMKKHGLDDWSFRYHTKKRAVGTCYYQSKTIALSRYHAEQSELKDIVDTLLHEIAHALTPGDSHGSRWVAACQRIGANPEKYFRGPVIDVPMKWTLECPVCGRQTKKARKPTRQLSCGRCSPTFDLKYLLTLKEPNRASKTV